MITIFCDSPEELHRTTADVIETSLQRAIGARGTATFALAGGSTPRSVYALLAASPTLAWEHIHLFFGDERAVPADSIDSNYRMAAESLLSHITIPPDNVHRVQTELGAEAAADEYESTLRRVCGSVQPRIDLVLLGIGPDGHTASLFPGQPQLESRRLITATPEATREPRVRRLTMTYPLLNAASTVIFLVSGEEKTPVVKRLIHGGEQAHELPASRVTASERLVWAVYPPPVSV